MCKHLYIQVTTGILRQSSLIDSCTLWLLSALFSLLFMCLTTLYCLVTRCIESVVYCKVLCCELLSCAQRSIALIGNSLSEMRSLRSTSQVRSASPPGSCYCSCPCSSSCYTLKEKNIFLHLILFLLLLLLHLMLNIMFLPLLLPMPTFN